MSMNLGENECVKQLKAYETAKLAMNEINFDFEDVEDCVVLDELGCCVRFGDIYEKKKSIIVFLRHFLCFTTSDYVEDLMRISAAALSDANAQLVIIGSGDWRVIESFRREMNCEYPIFVDRKLDLYRKLKFLPYMQANLFRNENAHIKSGLLYGILRSTWRAMKYPIIGGTVQQNGGALVVGPGNQLHLSHIDRTMFDKALINDLLIAAGLQPIDFKNDPRIETV